jgi:hypothetical protein
MVKPIIRAVLLALALPFRPVIKLYCWWMPLNLGNRRKAVILPDSMAIFMVFLTATFVAPYAFSAQVLSVKVAMGGTLIALFALPLLLTNVILVAADGVKVVRVFGVVPYWVHRVPADATFDLYESFDDVAPTGVAFEAAAYGGDPLHLGTATSAVSLYEHVAYHLQQAGWQRAAFGMQNRGANANAL